MRGLAWAAVKMTKQRAEQSNATATGFVKVGRRWILSAMDQPRGQVASCGKMVRVFGVGFAQITSSPFFIGCLQRDSLFIT